MCFTIVWSQFSAIIQHYLHKAIKTKNQFVSPAIKIENILQKVYCMNEWGEEILSSGVEILLASNIFWLIKLGWLGDISRMSNVRNISFILYIPGHYASTDCPSYYFIGKNLADYIHEDKMLTFNLTLWQLSRFSIRCS